MGAYRPEDLTERGVRGYRPEDLVEEEGLGTLAREIVSDHPFLSLGAALSVLVMGATAANALMFQPEPHPAPLFATRGPIAAERIEVAHKPVRISAPARAGSDATRRELLREVQTALAARGYYEGKVDGIAGSRTRTAIEAFQKDRALETTGKASVRLLTQILVSPASAPVKVPVATSRSPSAPDRIETASIVSDEVTGELIVTIQKGLREYGRSDIAVDGRMGKLTARAIADFELDFGWPITGKPTRRLVAKMREIGLLEG